MFLIIAFTNCINNVMLVPSLEPFGQEHKFER